MNISLEIRKLLRGSLLAFVLFAICSVAKGQTDQFPIGRFADEAIRASIHSGKPTLVFVVDYIDTASRAVRDKILANTEVRDFLNPRFELGLNDFSIDPPPSVGFDSLRHLGERLSNIETKYRIVARPTAIILTPEGVEMDRILFPNQLSPRQFIDRVSDIMEGRNTMGSFIETFWRDTTSVAVRLTLIEQFEIRSQYDSVLRHLEVLSAMEKQPLLAREASFKYGFLRLHMEGFAEPVRSAMGKLDRRKRDDSLLYLAGLNDLLDYYIGRKKHDSVSTLYNEIFSFTGTRPAATVNDYAWQIANYTHDQQKALKLVNEAIKKDPKDPNFYDTRAFIYHNLKKNKLAAQDAKKALELAPQNDREYFEEKHAFYTAQLQKLGTKKKAGAK